MYKAMRVSGSDDGRAQREAPGVLVGERPLRITAACMVGAHAWARVLDGRPLLLDTLLA